MAYSTVGVPPEIMGIGPVPAIQNVLKVAGLTLNDIDLIEVSVKKMLQNTKVLKFMAQKPPAICIDQ